MGFTEKGKRSEQNDIIMTNGPLNTDIQTGKTESSVSARLSGIGEYYFSKKLREIEELNKAGKRVINLGIGSPDLPPHPDVIKMLQQESAKPNTHAYQGYKGIAPLREAMAAWYRQWYGVTLDPATEVLPLMGSKEGIMHICMTYIDQGDYALIPDPGYPTYQSAVSLAGGIPLTYELTREHDWFPDFNELDQKIADLRKQHKKVKLMWVNYPHMPTGQQASLEVFEMLIRFGKTNGILICHDNPYSFILNDKPLSILSVKGALETALELNSLSKAQNMAGWRVGMMMGSKNIIENVLRFKSNMDSGMFQPIQKAAIVALSLGAEWYDHLNKTYRERRKKAIQLLIQLKCTITDKQAGLFIWAAISDRYQTGYELSDDILSKCKVFITPGGIFGKQGNGYVRVSLCSPVEQFDEAINRIGVD